MDEKSLPTPHNNFFQFALSNPIAARSLIETQLPDAVLKELKLDSLKIESGSFVDPDLREKHSDLLMSAELAQPESGKHSRAFVYLLFEHKSEPDPLTVLQLLSYILRIWEMQARERGKLSPIIPLVVYHGARGWTAAREIADLIAVPEAISAYQVQFRLPLLDLSQLTDEQISGEPLLQGVLRLLKYSRSEQLPWKLREILGILATELKSGGADSWIQAIAVYVMSVNKQISSDEFGEVVRSVWPTQIEPGSLADRLLKQGREEGREEGHRLGKLAGSIQTLQELLEIPVISDTELLAQPAGELEALMADLQQRLRERDK